MNAIVKLNVPAFQIGQEVTVFFKDTMMKKGICEAGEIVRCKDCKNYNTENCADGFGWCNRNGTGHGSTDNWFCADGERKE